MVSILAPWHSYVAGPGFPENPLYHRDDKFGEVEHVNVNYDEDYKLKSIIAESKTGDNASVEFELIEELNIKKMLCHLKKNSTTELTITEWFENDEVYLTFRRPNCEEYDVDINVALKYEKIYEYDVKIQFNNRLFNGIIKAKSLDVPQVVLDFSKEISEMQSNITIAAADPAIIGIITMVAYKMFYQEIRGIGGHILNAVGSLIAHIIFTCVGGVIAHIVSLLILPEELH